MNIATKLIEDGDRANSGLPDGPQRSTGARDTFEAAEKSGAFERLQSEYRLRSWEGEEDFREGAGGGVQGVQGRAAALEIRLTHFPSC